MHPSESTVSTNASFAARRRAVGALLTACGPLATFAVAGGGLCFGAMLWRASSAGLTASASILTLAGCLVVGALAALAAWLVSCAYYAKVHRFDLVVALRYDAWAYAGLVTYPIFALLPLGPGRDVAGATVAIASFTAGTLVTVARFDAAMRSTLWVFSITKIPIVAIALLSTAFIPEHGHGHPVISNDPYLNVFARWDAVHYLDIADRGYAGTDVAFFPLYPFLIRIGGWIVGSNLTAGLLISNAAFLFALFFLYRITEAQFDAGVARRATLYLAIFPTAFFFASVYSESLFLALTLGMFYYLREERWLLAGFLGGLAALTRVEGILLVVCYAVEILAPERNLVVAMRRSVAVRKHLAVGLAMIPAGLVAYMLLLWVLSNDPLAFTHAQAHWNRHFAWPWVSVERTVSLLATSHDAVTTAAGAIELAFASLVIVTTVCGLRRIRPSYTAFAILSIVVPLSTSTLMSTPRFALAIFPVFVILGLWGKREFAHTAILVTSLPLLGFFTVLFANWYWVA